MSMRFRVARVVAFLGLLASACHIVAQESQTTGLGISTVRTANGPSVRIGDEESPRWMVPYQEKIPGTDITFQMIPIPGGKANFGSPADEANRGEHEVLQRRVVIEPMWVAKLEVTREEFAEYEKLYRTFKEIDRSNSAFKEIDFQDADVVSAPTEVYDPTIITEHSPTEKHPIVSASHYAAKQYTKWLSFLCKRQYRLPTEAEWEYACRGDSQHPYAWGEDSRAANDHAWYFENTDADTHQVGALKKPNRFGIFDMHGNVAEWVIQVNAKDLGIAESKFKQLVSMPKESVEYGVQIAKGGHFYSTLDEIRAASRLFSNDGWLEDADVPMSPWWFTTEPATSVGFRVVRSLRAKNEEELRRFWHTENENLKFSIEMRLSGGRGAVGRIPQPKK